MTTKSTDVAVVWNNIAENPALSGDYIEGELPELKKMKLKKAGKKNESDEDLLDRIENYIACYRTLQKIAGR
ncbi:MAG: hypothetical protein SWH68_04385 [Thermodesulfobacteriota bacterium]|nr:hypothetical protein [Thermodesulfobacteriota bacterium]